MSVSRRQAVTMKEVAVRAGVSVSAVSAALSGSRGTIAMTETTRDRIVEVAREMEYRPNINARSLRHSATNIIGYLTGTFDPCQPFYAQLILGLRQGCDQHRKDLLLHGELTGRAPEEVYENLVNGRVDGLILNLMGEHPLLDRLATSTLPVINLVDAHPLFPSVVVNDAEGSRLLVEYLVQRGHRFLLFKRPSLELVSARRRRIAFEAACVEYGVRAETWASEDFLPDPEEVRTHLRLKAAPGERPTAVICWHDVAAYELMARCHGLGIRVPQEVALCGFDGFPSPSGVLWNLTTVRAPWPEVARSAVGMLVQRLEGKQIPHETILPVTFVAGDTA